MSHRSTFEIKCDRAEDDSRESFIENLSVVGVNALFFQGPHEKRKKVTKCEGTVRGMAVHIDSY